MAAPAADDGIWGAGLLPRAATGSESVAGGAGGAPPPAGEGVVREFHEALARSADAAVAVAAIQALTSVIASSAATTMMGLQRELEAAAAALQRCNPTAISLRAGCELFLRYTTRTSALECDSFALAKRRLIERGRRFAETSQRARATIAELGERFIRPGATVLVHGHSRVALAVLRRAAAAGRAFSVLVTEGRPDQTGLTMARALVEAGVPVTLVLDAGVGAAMERADMVLVGAEAVVESGGVINKLGTYTVALAAAAHGVPVYAAAESYKFARLFPLGQADLPAERKPLDLGPLLPAGAVADCPSRDYTPPGLLSLLFTDLGVLTPAAVSDELIMAYV
jgi:translation initiation factor eIF-2B subunit alpha